MPLLPPGVNERFPSDPGQLTPLFRQYTQIKAQQGAALLLYRLGDFYELFGPDAVRAAELLGLTLTSRACGRDYKLAMCGVPHHSAVRYIKRLVQAGEAVAICEQTEDPALAKGLVERSVTRVITAGTLVEDEYLSADASNFLAVIAGRGKRYGVALLESSGGGVELFELAMAPGEGLAALSAAVLRYQPAELLAPRALLEGGGLSALAGPGIAPALHAYDALPGESDVEGFLRRFFAVPTLAQFGLDGAPAAQAALFALVRYLRETFRVGEVKLYPRLVPLSGVLLLDRRTVEHLELFAPQGVPGAGTTAAGLLGLLGECQTSAGRRELKRLLLAPSADAARIAARHDAVDCLLAHGPLAQALTALLGQLQDVERIANRAALERTHPKEVRALADSLPTLTELGRVLRDAALCPPLSVFAGLAQALPSFAALHGEVQSTLADDPPLKLSDGGVIRPGADARIDELRALAGGSREWFVQYEQAERERTGIRTLKVKFTDAFGYFIEVGKSSAALVPRDYQRKQTLVNAERFTTPELNQHDADARSAGTQLIARERELFAALCATITQQAPALAAASRAAAALDVLLCFATLAMAHGWTRPQLSADGARLRLELDDARHPLVEQAVGARYYIPNACYLDQDEQQVVVLTGPNMGGKSTYLRMVAVLSVLNQAGSFVPARRAVLPVFDRIFTRVGAQDSLTRGQSTFMVEMLETAEILNTCGARSLVILDEVGRGTSTYDGISIAKAVVEYLHELPERPLTLFATHFFELTDLALVLPRVKNFQVQVAREGGTGGADAAAASPASGAEAGATSGAAAGGTAGRGRFVFLYRVAPGAASESFGIEVAALAGLPEAVIGRARQILSELEEAKAEARARARKAVQMGLFGEGETAREGT
jgi:DNA mismatch repair protein MutS